MLCVAGEGFCDLKMINSNIYYSYTVKIKYFIEV